MVTATASRSALVRFDADRLPTTGRPVVVLRGPPRRDGPAGALSGEILVLTLREDASRQDARELAERLNETVGHVGQAAVAG